MKVLVTGAAGNLGSAVCRVLAAGGVEVVATDRKGRSDLPMPVHVVDLLDRDALYPLAKGIDAAVHLGNHICFEPPDAQMIFGENTLMNVNVFQAAVDQGARKLVFASSIQVFGSVPRLPEGHAADQPAYLPLDGESPPFPTNPYALSKQTGEVMLAYYTRVFGVDTIAVRRPGLRQGQDLNPDTQGWEKTMPQLRPHAFSSYLSFADAAELVAAILRAPLPGNRIYMPTPKINMLRRPAAEVIRQYYADVPLRQPIDQIEGLVDLARIQRETGWSPRE